MTLVCPTLRTAAVGVTRAGSTRRRQAARGWQSNERPNFPGVRSYFVMPQRRHRAALRFWLELGAFVSLFSVFRSMARLLLRLPTRASRYNMAIKRVECGAGKLRGRDHDDMLCR